MRGISIPGRGLGAWMLSGAVVWAAYSGGSARGQAAPASQPYQWKSVQMVGGGFVDGIVFHPTEKGLSYCRTDIGGSYRRDDQKSPWVPITDWVSLRDSNLLGSESIALDPNDANKVYIASGMYANTNAVMLRSNDKGKTFLRTPVPFGMGGNADGRGNGERLKVDPNDGNILYFGSRTAGLWRSTDASVTWKNVASFPIATAGGGGGGRGAGGGGDGIVFVMFDPKSGNKGKASTTIFAGVSLTGQNSVFKSTDAGATWAAVAGQPTTLRPTRAAWGSDGTLYIPYSTAAGPGGGTNGAVWKLNTTSGEWTNITPVANPGCGYAAVSVDAKSPQVAIASTAGHQGGEEIYRTLDAGKTWIPIIKNPKTPCVYDYTGHPYTVHTGIHWLADIEIDPFDSNHAMFTVGYGGWETFNLTDIDSGKPVKWVTDSTGIEETVALSLLSPTGGAHLITAIGDYGGFVHWDLDKPAPEGNFTNPFFGNTNDVAAGYKNPDVVIRVGTQGGGQNGGARGTMGYSLDAGKTWQPPKTSPGGANGFACVGTDGKTWIWSPGGGGGRGGGAGGAPGVTTDHGDTWAACKGLPNGTRVVADTVNPQKFYAITLGNSTFYASTDGGQTFAAQPMTLQGEGRGGNRGDARGGQDKIYATPEAEGDLWIAAADGLFHTIDAGKTFVRADSGVTQLSAFGFGKAAPDAKVPAMYMVGTVGGTRGVFRSIDGAKNWVRINDDDHQWGLVLQITGDPRIYGRVYVGTHGRGTLYGDPPAK